MIRMLKTLSVGKKLGVGYGTIIVFLVVILIITMFTSLQRNTQLDVIDNVTNMQQEANTLLSEVYDARIELRTVFTVADYEEEYAKAISSLKSAQSRVDTMDEYIARMAPSEAQDFIEANSAIRQNFSDLFTALDGLTASDVAVAENKSTMQSATDTMVVNTTEMVSLIVQLLVDRMDDEPELTKTRLQSALIPTIELSKSVDEMASVSSVYLIYLESDKAEIITSQLNEIEADLSALQGVLTTPEAQAAADEVSSSITAYRDAFKQVQDGFILSMEYADKAISKLDDLTSVLNVGAVALNTTVIESVDSLISSSYVIMFLLIGIGVLSVVMAIGCAIVITRALKRPLAIMQAVMMQASEVGDLHFSEDTRNAVLKEAEGKDEVAQSLKQFAHLIDRISYIGECLEKVAEKDLTLDIDLLSDQDTMGQALKTMLDNLNEMFRQINTVAQQVSTSSGEIATGAQALAQGSTEQASTVEEISASINEITQQANVSVETANQAAQDSQSIRNIAQEGNEKMDRLSIAVQEMSDASRSIGDVIKVIDDIAFQTNILALNAAVEAARAGEHGKGFAVVADEVRNLAGKSAEAAKETADLISANIEKSSVGLAISQETAESLQQIVEGVEHTTGSLHSIAQQSEGSKLATEQVNLAVDQVAQVVQQNSATSQQSAAASQEMSSQAHLLQQLIAQFRMRETEQARIQGLPEGIALAVGSKYETNNAILF